MLYSDQSKKHCPFLPVYQDDMVERACILLTHFDLLVIYVPYLVPVVKPSHIAASSCKRFWEL